MSLVLKGIDLYYTNLTIVSFWSLVKDCFDYFLVEIHLEKSFSVRYVLSTLNTADFDSFKTIAIFLMGNAYSNLS